MSQSKTFLFILSEVSFTVSVFHEQGGSFLIYSFFSIISEEKQKEKIILWVDSGVECEREEKGSGNPSSFGLSVKRTSWISISHTDTLLQRYIRSSSPVHFYDIQLTYIYIFSLCDCDHPNNSTPFQQEGIKGMSILIRTCHRRHHTGMNLIISCRKGMMGIMIFYDPPTTFMTVIY